MYHVFSHDQFGIETKQITFIFQVWDLQVVTKHRSAFLFGKYILNTRVLFMLFVGFIYISGCFEAFSKGKYDM